MLKQLIKGIHQDADYPERSYWYDIYCRVFDGTIYDHLKYAFHQEVSNQERIELIKRRPAVRFNLSKIIVNDSVSMLFDESHFPNIKTDDEKILDYVNDIYDNTNFRKTMLKAAIIGSLGSVAVWLRVLSNKLYFKPLKTEYLTAEFDENEPDKLIRITEKYKISAQQVNELGYAVDLDGSAYWFCREWDETQEIYYVPWRVKDEKEAKANNKPFKPRIDKKKTTEHGLGFVPFVWIKNLPTLDEDDLDGQCTFAPIIDNQIEIDYQLSQLGRGLKYSSEPLLVIKTNSLETGEVDKSKGNALCLDAESDAKMLEINGDFANVVIEYAESLRKLSLEVVGANRVDPEKFTSAQSGKAMELMNQSLVWLTSKLRVSYGDALEKLIEMAIDATQTFSIQIKDRTYSKLKIQDSLKLNWPPYFLPTSSDKQADATTLSTLKNAGLISTETAVQNLSANYDVIEPDEEIKKIKSETQETMQMQMKQQSMLNKKEVDTQ